MNKGDLIQAIAEKADMTIAEAGRALNATLESIREGLQKGDTVSLVGFGSFAVNKRAARNGRNPRTGETMSIAARNQPSFKPGKGLKEAVNLDV